MDANQIEWKHLVEFARTAQQDHLLGSGNTVQQTEELAHLAAEDHLKDLPRNEDIWRKLCGILLEKMDLCEIRISDEDLERITTPGIKEEIETSDDDIIIKLVYPQSS